MDWFVHKMLIKLLACRKHCSNPRISIPSMHNQKRELRSNHQTSHDRHKHVARISTHHASSHSKNKSTHMLFPAKLQRKRKWMYESDAMIRTQVATGRKHLWKSRRGSGVKKSAYVLNHQSSHHVKCTSQPIAACFVLLSLCNGAADTEESNRRPQ